MISEIWGAEFTKQGELDDDGVDGSVDESEVA